MTMIACAECGATVSDTAKTCPSCGTSNKRMKKAKQPTPRWFKIAIAVFIAAIAIAVAVQDNKPAPLQSPQEIAAARVEDLRNRSAYDAATTLKAHLRDPSSLHFERISVNEDGSIVCLRYRARNGFGGLGLEQMVFNDGDGTSSPSAWRKHCKHVELYDLTSVGSLIR